MIEETIKGETMKVYKFVRMKKDGKCYPLFIDKKKPFTFGVLMKSEYHPTKGFAPRSIDEENPNGGWHCCFKPIAPHLKKELKKGEKRVWIECEGSGKCKKYKKPESQGGMWILYEELTPLRILDWDEVERLAKS